MSLEDKIKGFDGNAEAEAVVKFLRDERGLTAIQSGFTLMFAAGAFMRSLRRQGMNEFQWNQMLKNMHKHLDESTFQGDQD